METVAALTDLKSPQGPSHHLEAGGHTLVMKVVDVTRMRYGTTHLYWAEMSVPASQMLTLTPPNS